MSYTGVESVAVPLAPGALGSPKWGWGGVDRVGITGSPGAEWTRRIATVNPGVRATKIATWTGNAAGNAVGRAVFGGFGRGSPNKPS